MEYLAIIGFIALFIYFYFQFDNKVDPDKWLYSNDHEPEIDLQPTNWNFTLPVFNKQRYLQSIQWKEKRKQVLKRDNYTCCKCHASNVPLEVHHITYRNYGDEPLQDLVSVCRNCHQSIHDKYGYDYNGHYPIT